MGFPQGRLPFRAEAAFGTDLNTAPNTWTWTDVSDRVLDQTVTITHGSQNESGGLTPASLGLELDNPDGAFTPDHPMSPHWPHVVLGTPLRYSLRGQETALVLDGDPASNASTPDHPSLSIAGGIDVRAEVAADWYRAEGNQTLIGQWGDDGNRSWVLRLFDGVLTLTWTTGGTLATQLGASFVLPAMPGRAAVRFTLDPDNGAGGVDVAAYWAASLDGPWVPFGSATGGGTTSIYDSTAPLAIAPHGPDSIPPRVPFAGRGYRFEVRDGLDGPAVANPDFRALAEGATAFTDAAGRPWTVNDGAAVTAWRQRFFGNVGEWNPAWPYGDLSTSTDPGESRVSVTAAGVLRRLQQGQKALDSTLRRRVPSGNPIAYWPLEEGEDAVRAYSPIAGVEPLTTTGFAFAADATMPGATALPKLTAAASISGAIPPSTASGWQVELVYFLPALPASQTEILRVAVAGSAMRTAIVYASTAGIRVEARDDENMILGFFTFTDPDALGDFWGVWNRLAFFVSDDGGGQTRLVANWRDISNLGGTWTSATTFTAAMGAAVGVSGSWGAATENMTIGHLAAFDVAGTLHDPGVSIYDGADDGFNGETAGARLQRLGAEEGTPVQVLGPPGDSARMGPQRPNTLLALLSECAVTDGGILGEQREGSGLEYLPRTSLYNRPVAWTIDAGLNELAHPFAPVLDDKAQRNDSQVSRTNGSSGRRADLESIARSGLYDEQITVNAYRDSDLPGIAQWRVHIGTWPHMRYPKITSDLAIAPQGIDAWLSVGSGSRIQVVNLPPQHPPGPVDSLVQGITETITPTRWTATATCSPAGPWTVGVVEDPVLGRADTDGSELASAVTESDTILSIATTAGPVWVSDQREYPFDLTVGGEAVTAAAAGTLLHPNPLLLEGLAGWSGLSSTIALDTDIVHTALGAVASIRVTPSGASSASLLATDHSPVGSVTPGASYTMSAWVYTPDGWPDMRIIADWYNAADTILSSSPSVAIPVPAGVWTYVTLTAAAPASASRAGLRARIGVSPTATDLSYWWALRMVPDASVTATSPQTMTVIRSVNGITKAHSAGTALSLTQPTIVAL